MNVQAKAQLKNLRMSPQKVRLIAGLIRGLSVIEARKQLMFSSKHAARPILKLLNSAVANAIHNYDMKEDTLKVETIFVDEGSTLKRWMPRAMGRATPLRKRSSHITLIVDGEQKESKKTTKKIKKEVSAEKVVTEKEDDTEASISAKATVDKKETNK